MVFNTETNDKDNLIVQFNIVKSFIVQSLTFQKQKRKMLRRCLDKICYTIDSIVDVNNVTVLSPALENVKIAITASDFNINKLIEMQNFLEKLSFTISKSTFDSTNDICIEMNKYNATYSNIEEIIVKNTHSIDEFLLYFIDNCNFYIADSSIQNPSILPSSLKNTQTLESSNISDQQKAQNKNLPTSLSDYKTLLISEKTQKVYLPYSLEEVKNLFNGNPNKYTNIEDVISKEYIVPLSRYKTPSLARFKEAFNLMRNKEHSSFLDSFNLAFELSHNSLLNPAVITACKNLDELDIYLDCLDSNELDKFNLFKIVFEILPTKK